MQCIYLHEITLEKATTLNDPKTKEDIIQTIDENDSIDLDKKRYACLTGPGKYETTKEDIKAYCSFSDGDPQHSNFTYCPRYRAITEIKGKVNYLPTKKIDGW